MCANDCVLIKNGFLCFVELVIFQQRVRVFDHGIKTRESNES